MTFLILRVAIVVAYVAGSSRLPASVGADMPWTTYEAESMHSTGIVLGPTYDPYRVETEASGQKCVQLTAVGQFVEFIAAAKANALVIRTSLPDAAAGGGTNSALSLFINGKEVRTLALTSRYSWLYGNYPFFNEPEKGKPRNFYDELRVKDLNIAQGDVVRLQKTTADEFSCIVDFVDLENIAPALAEPKNPFPCWSSEPVAKASPTIRKL